MRHIPGTSYHAAQLGAYLLRAAGRFAWAEHSHDFASYPFPLGPHDAVIVISHTGWKQYSRRCIERAHGAGAWCLAITGENTALPGDGSGGSPHQVLPPVEAFFTTDLTLSLDTLLGQYRERWAVEITIRDSNAFAGFGQDQCRKRERVVGANTLRLVLAAARTLWFVAHGAQQPALELRQ